MRELRATELRRPHLGEVGDGATDGAAAYDRDVDRPAGSEATDRPVHGERALEPLIDSITMNPRNPRLKRSMPHYSEQKVVNHIRTVAELTCSE